MSCFGHQMVFRPRKGGSLSSFNIFFFLWWDSGSIEWFSVEFGFHLKYRGRLFLFFCLKMVRCMGSSNNFDVWGPRRLTLFFLNQGKVWSRRRFLFSFFTYFFLFSLSIVRGRFTYFLISRLSFVR